MRRSITNLLIGALAFTLNVGLVSAAEKDARERLDDRTHEVNQKAEKSRDLALQRISTETGIPLSQVQDMSKRHPKVGPAGILMAGVLADETKKDPEQFLEKRDSGKRWAAIAKENNVSAETLNNRLDRLDKALGNPKADKNKEK